MKVFLIMDMPERCDKCLLFLSIPQKNGLALCLARQATEQEKYNPKYEKSWRPEWCPLRELPEKETEMTDADDLGVDYVRGTMDGWNACLDEIAGE